MIWLRIISIPLFPFYWLATIIRNKLYDANILKTTTFDHVALIGIGNLSVGGSGKTPLTEFLVRKLSNKYKTVILSRGYKRKTKGFRIGTDKSTFEDIGDEPMQYYMKFKNIMVCVCENRIEGISNIMKKQPETQLIILDDNFQHRSLKVDFQILLSTFAKPFYKDSLLPFGNLREGKRNAKRAQHLILTKSPNELDDKKMNQVKNEAVKYFKGSISFSHVSYSDPYLLRTLENTTFPKKVTLVSGIAKPDYLYNYVRSKAHIKKHFDFPDHYHYKSRDIWQFNRVNVPIVTTEKDATKLRDFLKELIVPVIVIPMETEFISGEAEFMSDVTNTINQKISPIAVEA